MRIITLNFIFVISNFVPTKIQICLVYIHVWYWDKFHDYFLANWWIAGYIVNSGWRGWHGQAVEYKIYWTICTDRILYWIWGKKTQINRSFWSKVQSSFIINSQFNKFYFLPKNLFSHKESLVLRKPSHLAELLSQLPLFWNIGRYPSKYAEADSKMYVVLFDTKTFHGPLCHIVAHKLHFCKVDLIIYTCSLDIYYSGTSMLWILSLLLDLLKPHFLTKHWGNGYLKILILEIFTSWIVVNHDHFYLNIPIFCVFYHLLFFYRQHQQ